MGDMEMKVSDLADALFRDYTINRRKSLKTLKSRWEGHLKAYFEPIPAETLSTDQIECYIALRLEQKAESATVNRELAALKRLYSLALRYGKLCQRRYIPHLKEHN